MINHQLVVSKSIEILAPSSKIWEVLTQPALISQYLHGTETLTDWKVGSDIIFQGEYEGHSYKDKGVVLENIPNQRLQYRYWSGFSGLEDKLENYSVVTYQIEPIDETKSLFTWQQEGFANEEGQQHSEQGLMSMLEQIRDIALHQQAE